MSVKTAGVGHFQIPTAPAAGQSVTSGAANNFTGTAIVLSASTSAIYITGVHVESSAALAATYICVQLMIGANGAETAIGQYLVPLTTASTVALGFRPIFPPIPVANGTRLSVKTADSVGSKATLITVECILQSNVVDDGIAVTTVTTVTNQLTAAAIATGVWQDATAGDFSTASSIGKSLYTTGAVPGASGGLQIAGSNAATTYATLTVTGAFTVNGTSSVSQTGDSFAVVKSGGTGDNAAIKTKTDFLPSATAGAAGGVFIAGTNAATTITTSLTTTFTGNLTGSVASVTGAVGSVTGAVGSVTGAVGSVTGAVGSVTSRVTANADQLAGQTVTAAAGVTFPSSVASPTNITAGTITTVTNLTNAPTNGDLTAAMKTSVTAAATASTPTAAAVTGNVGGNVTGSVGSVVGLTASNLDTTVSSRLATTGYTAPDNADIASIKTKTDSLTFTKAGEVDANIQSVNDTTVTGTGSEPTPWGP